MLEVRGLTKRYSGLPAVNKVSFTVNRGEILGYLGPNGSGKSTTVNMVVGLLEPSAGSILLDGGSSGDDPDGLQAAHRLRARGTVSLHAPDRHRVPDAGRAPARHGPRRASIGRCRELLRLFLLYDSRYSTMAAYSKGMRQRVLLAAALLHDPDLLVLDEPFSGLDVNASLLFRALLDCSWPSGRMILFSSHRFDMVEKVCSRAVILRDGRVVAEHRVESASRARWLGVARGCLRAGDPAGGLHARRRSEFSTRPVVNACAALPSALRDR